ncbi:phosphatidylinositol-glycan biosynthesis class S protein, partial [Dimargaris cristalligena]
EQRTVRHTSAYQLSFSLFNGDASSGPTDWAIESALQATIRPFLTRLGPLFNFTVDSQIQYYSTLPIRPTPIQIDSQTTEYALYPRDLPHFVNTQDWNLDSTETNMPLLNFVLYVPPAHLSPLVVREADGTPSPYNAFLAPRWGGIVVNNPPHRPIAQLSGGDLLGPSRIFVSQLRGLLGVPDFADIVSPLQNEWIVESDPNSGPGISPWEFDLLQAKRNVENVAEAINTLNSLDRLVESIPNMVVQDSIQEKFDDSIQKGRFGEAYTHSRQALALAESAFFDPSMVSMLYFPNDHKFGVYMPLFVPILVPIIIAVLKEIKEWRQLRNQSKIKTQ